MNILTFDLEEWFHILDYPETSSPSSWDAMESRIEKNTDRILTLLEDKNLKATWFCLGWVAKKYPSLIKKISIKHEIACHSTNHQLLFQMKKEDARADIQNNIHLLEDLSGKKINAYRAPGFSSTEKTKWLIPLLAEAGILYDCSIFPLKRNHGGYHTFPVCEPCRISFDGIEIKEFPMNKISILGTQFIFSGGGYFRLLPYSIISALMKKSSYVMTYFHPRDFDPGQPVLENLSLKRKFMSYTGLKKSLFKLNCLLNDHTFNTVEEAAGQINWETTSLINLEKY